MPVTRCTTRLALTTGVLADSAVNVLHFEHAGALDATIATKIGAALDAAYSNWGPYLSTAVIRGAATHEQIFTTLTPGAAGADDDVVSKVEFIRNFAIDTIPDASAKNLPNEVAACLSFRGDITGLSEEASGGTVRPISRRRGRIYVGPLSGFGLIYGTNNDNAPRFSDQWLGQLVAQFAVAIETLSNNAPIINLVVYSPTTGLTWPIVHCWADNAPDIIRSRGVLATSRWDNPLAQDPI